MIQDNVIVCYFPKEVFPSISLSELDPLLRLFFREWNPTSVIRKETWFEVNCISVVSEDKISKLNSDFHKDMVLQLPNHDYLRHCKILLRVMLC